MTIPPYLQSYLRLADELEQRLDGCSIDEIALLQGKIRRLVELCANRDAQIRKLEQRAAGADRASA